MDENLNRWIDAIELLIKQYMMRFETTYNFDDKSVQNIAGLNHKIKDMFEAVEDYATSKGIILKEYLTTYHKGKIINNFFTTFYEKGSIGFASDLNNPDSDDNFDR